MISVQTAFDRLDEHRPDWGFDTIPLHLANNHVLSEDIIAPLDQPSHSVSVMDGYAMRKSDASGTLNIVGESRAGEPFSDEINPGEAIRIFTGAIIPKGADHIEIQEYAVVDNNNLRFPKKSIDRNYVREAGSDFLQGDILFTKNTTITPAIIMALATANISHVRVHRKPTIALLRGGDELKPVGELLDGKSIIDSIGPALLALLKHWGFPVIDLGIVADNPDEIKDRIENSTADIIVPIGGASVGEYDYMKGAFFEVGFDPIFTKVAVKPGKPTWFSKNGEKLVLGLPGNPSSAWVCTHIFLAYLIGRQLTWKTLKLSSPIPKNGNRDTFLRAKTSKGRCVAPLPSQDSGLILPLSVADALIWRKANTNDALCNSEQTCLML